MVLVLVVLTIALSSKHPIIGVPMRHNYWLRFGLALVFVIPVAAQDYWSAPPFSVEPDVLLRAASAISVPEGTDAIVLSETMAYSFDDAGRRTVMVHRIYKVLSPGAIRDWDSTGARWEPWHEDRPTLRARVISADGSVHELDQKTIAELPVSEDNGTLSDARIVRAPLPAIASGSIVEDETRVSETSPSLAAGYSSRVYFGYSVPTKHTTFTLEAPSSVQIRYATRLLPTAETEKRRVTGEPESE